MTIKIPQEITLQHLIDAISDLDRGVPHKFGESTAYDVLYQGHRYAPKAVIGLAAEKLTGMIFGPRDFQGGLKSPCFRILKLHGFTIVKKKRSPPFLTRLKHPNGTTKELCNKYFPIDTSATQRLDPLPSSIMDYSVTCAILISKKNMEKLERDLFTYTTQSHSQRLENPTPLTQLRT